MQSYGYYNSFMKLCEFLILLLVPLFVPSFLGMVFNLVLIMIIFPYVYLETYEKKMLLQKLWVIFGLILLGGALISYLCHLETYIYFGYNITPLVHGIMWGLYGGNLYLYGTIISRTTSLFEACMSLHDTAHFSRRFSYRLYRGISFLKELPAEYRLVKNVYASRCMVEYGHFKMLNLVVRNLNRKFKSSDLMMEAKGFDRHQKETKNIHLRLVEWIIPLAMLVGDVALYYVSLKGWFI